MTAILDIETSGNQSITGIYPSKKHSSKYLLYYLQQNKESIVALNIGSAQPHINKNIVDNFYVVLPEDIIEQSKIAEILSTCDKAIVQTEAIIEKYKRIKTGLMQDLLTKGIDENGNIRSEETHEFVVKNGIKVPKEWEVSNIGDLASKVKSGITPRGGSKIYQKSGILLIRSQNVLTDEFKLEDVAYINEKINSSMLSSEIFEFDVLLNITGASIGRSVFVPCNFPKANVNQHVCAIRLDHKNEERAIYVSSFLNSEFGQIQIKRINAGSNREGLNYQQVREITVPIPLKSEEIDKISTMIQRINKSLEHEKLNLAKYLRIKTGLMQDLLSGKVRVEVKEQAN